MASSKTLRIEITDNSVPNLEAAIAEAKQVFDEPFRFRIHSRWGANWIGAPVKYIMFYQKEDPNAGF